MVCHLCFKTLTRGSLLANKGNIRSVYWHWYYYKNIFERCFVGLVVLKYNSSLIINIYIMVVLIIAGIAKTALVKLPENLKTL